jgi:hypothetical protein
MLARAKAPKIGSAFLKVIISFILALRLAFNGADHGAPRELALSALYSGFGGEAKQGKD